MSSCGPPQFGPNGSVLNTPSLSDESRADDLSRAEREMSGAGSNSRSSVWFGILIVLAFVAGLALDQFLPDLKIGLFVADAMLLVLFATMLPVAKWISIVLIATPLILFNAAMNELLGWELNLLLISEAAMIGLMAWLLPKLGFGQ